MRSVEKLKCGKAETLPVAPESRGAQAEAEAAGGSRDRQHPQGSWPKGGRAWGASKSHAKPGNRPTGASRLATAIPAAVHKRRQMIPGASGSLSRRVTNCMRIERVTDRPLMPVLTWRDVWKLRLWASIASPLFLEQFHHPPGIHPADGTGKLAKRLIAKYHHGGLARPRHALVPNPRHQTNPLLEPGNRIVPDHLFIAIHSDSVVVGRGFHPNDYRGKEGRRQWFWCPSVGSPPRDCSRRAPPGPCCQDVDSCRSGDFIEVLTGSSSRPGVCTEPVVRSQFLSQVGQELAERSRSPPGAGPGSTCDPMRRCGRDSSAVPPADALDRWVQHAAGQFRGPSG